MSTDILPLCAACRRYRGVTDVGLVCDAYPAGIPVEILSSGVDHTQPYRGDHGMQYSQGEPRLAADEWLESDHPRRSDGKFGSGGSTKASTETMRFTKSSVVPKELNGVSFNKWKRPKKWADVSGQKKDLKEPPFDVPRDMRPASGVIIHEPDGRVWLVKPEGGFGGYYYTFPKGGVEKTLNPQANAIKEAYEESGLKVKITGFAGDYEGDTSVTRLYHAVREGGRPTDHGKETEKVSLVPKDEVLKFLNRSRDRKVAKQHLLPPKTAQDEKMRVATDPPVSEAQRRAMFAAAAGHGKIGIPKGVGEEFAEADPGGKLPEKAKDAVARAKDMASAKWVVLKKLFNEWINEEQAEAEHQAADSEKCTKAEAEYSKGKPGSRCDECEHYGQAGACELVEGEVDPDGWCKFFHTKAEPAEDDGLPAPKGRAASVMFVTEDGRVLLLRRADAEENFPGHWAFPGGKCEEGETAQDAAERETYEEVGDCSFDGIKSIHSGRTEHGWDHTTFAVPVKDSFAPRLNGEHNDWCWVYPDELPDPVHPKVDALLKNLSGEAEDGAADPEGKLSKTTREDIGTVGSGKREDMPEGVFLEPGERKYPVKEKRDGEWKYTRNLLLAAAREARMHGKEDVAKRADEIRAREFGGEEAEDAFSESDHPRDNSGKFAAGYTESGKAYPHSRETHETHAEHHENEAARHYKDATLSSAHREAARRHKTAAASNLKSAEGKRKSHSAYHFAVANRLTGAIPRAKGQDGTPEGGPRVTIEFAPGADNLSQFIEFLRYVKDAASGGHSFLLAADESAEGTGRKEFGKQLAGAVCFMDGDGSDHIARIFLDDKDVTKENKAVAQDTADVFAFDRASARSYDANGNMHVERSHISKATVNDYFGREINAVMKDKPGWVPLEPDRRYRMLRDPEELRAAQSSFNNLPILRKHVPISASKFKPEEVIGSTGSHATFDGEYLDNSLAFWTNRAIDDIEDDEKKQLSSAYSYRADMTPGEYKGMPYDGVMRDIKGNHVALVKEGRAGPEVAVNDELPPEVSAAWNRVVDALLAV